MNRSIITFSFVFALTFAYCEASAETPNSQNPSPEQFEVPETQYEKLKLLDELEEAIEKGEKEIEEWSTFQSRLHTASTYNKAFTDLSYLDGLVKNLKAAIVATQKNPNKNENIQRQFKLEFELINHVNNMIPEELNLMFDWFKGVESPEVLTEMRSFQQIIDEILKRVNKNDPYLSSFMYGGSSNNRENLLFQDTTSVNFYLTTVQKAIKEIPIHLAEYMNTIDQNIKSTKSEIDSSKKNLSDIYNEDSKKVDINALAIKIGLPAFCLTILLLYIIPQWIKRSNSDHKNDFTALLQLITVFLLTMTILILGLSGILTGEVLGTLIGGVSGYVLNKSVTATQSTQNKPIS